jgi:hypothetical protein
VCVSVCRARARARVCVCVCVSVCVYVCVKLSAFASHTKLNKIHNYIIIVHNYKAVMEAENRVMMGMTDKKYK